MNYLDFPHYIITPDNYMTDHEWDTWLDEQKARPLDAEDLRIIAEHSTSTPPQPRRRHTPQRLPPTTSLSAPPHTHQQHRTAQ